jgi:hypothetical protein
MKLKNIRFRGRYKHKQTDQEVNVKTGRNSQRGTDHHFYTYRGKRVFITDAEFYNMWEKIA